MKAAVVTLRKEKPMSDKAREPAGKVQPSREDLTRRLLLSTLMRESRERSGKSLDEMAKLTGLSKSTLSEMERDFQIDPRISTVKRICWAYEFSIARIANHDIED